MEVGPTLPCDIWHTVCPPTQYFFSRRDIVSENQSSNRHHSKDPEAGRDIPRGTDEESDAEGSSGDSRKSAKRSTSGGQHSDDVHRSRNDRDQDR